MCDKSTGIVPRVSCGGALGPMDTNDVAEQLAKLFVTKFKPSYEDEAVTAIENVLDTVVSEANFTEADLNNPAVQALIFAQANQDLAWVER